MKVIVTCGPGYEPIDEVRRITNFSTGELGFMLATTFQRAGFDVTCLKGELSTSREPLEASRVLTFTTNESLLALLAQLAGEGDAGVVMHAAALCDYKVASVLDSEGKTVEEPKIQSRSGALHLRLEPTEKVIRHLRRLFPGAFLIGWKYELNGTRQDAIAAARAQIAQNGTDVCIVNGRAFGNGFGVVTSSPEVALMDNKKALSDFLLSMKRGL
jgi:phosphopantothenoylcysteine decarboxylase/phosphopantothenate--cysteine ligase